MRLLRSLLIVIVALGGLILVSCAQPLNTAREKQLEKQLKREHLMRISDSVLHDLRQVARPNRESIVNLLGTVWNLCFGAGDFGVDATAIGTAHVWCRFTPEVGTYHEQIKTMPNEEPNLSEHVNGLLVNRRVDVTVVGFEGSETVFPGVDGRGKNSEGTKTFDPVVVMRFQIYTRPITDMPGDLVKRAAWIRFTEPTYEFPADKSRKQ